MHSLRFKILLLVAVFGFLVVAGYDQYRRTLEHRDDLLKFCYQQREEKLGDNINDEIQFTLDHPELPPLPKLIARLGALSFTDLCLQRFDRSTPQQNNQP